MLHLKRKDIDTTYISYEAISYFPLNFCRAHLDSLLEFVHKGVAEGAKLVYGGKQIDRPGELSDIHAADYVHVCTFLFTSQGSYSRHLTCSIHRVLFLHHGCQ